MVNVNFSFLESLGNTPNAAASFFSSLNAAFGGGSAGAGLFDNILAETQTNASLANPGASSANTPSNGPLSNVMSVGNSNGDVLSSLQNVVSAWSGFVQKWQNYQNNNGSQNSSAQTAGAADNKSAANTSSGNGSNAGATITAQTPDSGPPNAAPPQTPLVVTTNNSANVAPNSANSALTDAAAQSTSSDPKAPLTLAELLAELQAMLQMLQQQIQNAKLGNTAVAANAQDANALTADSTNAANMAPAANPASSGAPDNSLLSAADMMIEMIQLAQFAEKRLGLAQDPANNTQNAGASAPSSATMPDLAALDAQLRANLKTLLDAVQANLAANGAGSTGAANNIPSSQTALADATVQLSTGAAITDLTPTPAPSPLMPPSAIISSALSVASDFVKQLNNLFAASTNTAPTAFVPVGDVNAFSTASPGNTSFDSSMTDDGNSNSASTGGAPSGNVNTPTSVIGSDGVKQFDPYSFASQLSATRAANGGATGLPSAVEQVLFQLSRNVKNGNDQMTLQLQPADLGQINIKLDFSSDGKVQGTVIANNPVTLDMLQKDVRSLERALQDAGLSADPGSLQFSLGGQSDNTPGQTAGNSSSNSSSPDDNAAAFDVSAAGADVTDSTETWYITPGRVNMQV